MQEPDAEVNSLNAIATTVIDSLKSFLITFWEFPKVPVDERLSAGSLLVEYLFPLLLDDYILEDQLLQFMYEVTMIKKAEFKNLLFDLLELTLSSDQMKVFTEKLFTVLAKKILNQEVLTNQQNKPSKKDFDMIYF